MMTVTQRDEAVVLLFLRLQLLLLKSPPLLLHLQDMHPDTRIPNKVVQVPCVHLSQQMEQAAVRTGRRRQRLETVTVFTLDGAATSSG